MVPDTNVGNIYSGTEVNGPEMKLRKWKALFQTKEYLNCKGENEIRDFQVFKIGSKFSMEPDIIGVNEEIRTVNGEDKLYVLDDFYYIGRVVMNLNDGKKGSFYIFKQITYYHEKKFKTYSWTDIDRNNDRNHYYKYNDGSHVHILLCC